MSAKHIRFFVPAAVNAARAAGDGVYVDHGEAYGNLGEEAMILTALARFQKRFHPRVIYVTHAAGEPLPVGHLSKVRSTPSPFRAFAAAVAPWTAVLWFTLR